MTDAQKQLLGSDIGLAFFPYSFKEAILNHCNYDYKREKITDVLSAPIGQLGKFWKFIDGVKYFDIISTEKIVLSQQNGQSYGCLVPLLHGVESVTVTFKNGKSEKFVLDTSIFKKVNVCTIDFDYDNPILKMLLHFNFDLAEPLELNFEIEEYKEPEIDYRKIYLENMNVSHSCGQDLVNIRFQNADERVLTTQIELYSYEKGNRQIMGIFEVEKGLFFKSINGLAYGKYSYKVKQYDKDNSLIVETEYIDFSISAPHHGGRQAISWN